jgi:DNA-binding response OmpR family regulator
VAVRRPLRVLAVEDDPSLRAFYGTFLADEGYDVRLASNGLEGLRELGWDPDLILLDLVMPLLDGYEFLRRLRASPETTHIPVLVLSGATVKDRAALDAQAVLEKPFDFARLLRAVETFARGAPGAAPG